MTTAELLTAVLDAPRGVPVELEVLMPDGTTVFVDDIRPYLARSRNGHVFTLEGRAHA